MLSSLTIKNLALIEDLHLDFSQGFNVITGETGSGKTIILEALGLALGRKASATQVRQGATKLTVSAVFDEIPARVKSKIRALDLTGDEATQLILRRDVDAAGKSRAFVNDQPASLAVVAELGEFLVYMHGQHDHQLLMKSAEQRGLLDAFGELNELVSSVAESFLQWRQLNDAQTARSLSEQERAQKIDLYKFQLAELDKAALKEGEDEKWEKLLPQLRNAEKIKTGAEAAYDALKGGDSSAVSQIKSAEQAIKNLESLGAPITDAAAMLNEAVVKIEHIAAEADRYLSTDGASPEKLDQALTRLDLISRLERKYGPTLTDVVANHARVRTELALLENWEVESQDLDAKLKKAAQDLSRKCAKLHEARAAAAKRLSSAVQKEFRDVGLPKATLNVAVNKKEGAPTAQGQDDIQFLFSPNPGEGEKGLAEVASGGELSRVMLALATVLSASNEVPLLIFDEIDAGVGGELGGVIGKKLAALAKRHQVVCITHLASIAACAEKHFTVEKDIKGSRTHTSVKELAENERVLEIARLFGGVKVPKTGDSVSIKHARELLSVSRN
jgi:DNA repair protein RecN (Recombination protein N)